MNPTAANLLISGGAFYNLEKNMERDRQNEENKRRQRDLERKQNEQERRVKEKLRALERAAEQAEQHRLDTTIVKDATGADIALREYITQCATEFPDDVRSRKLCEVQRQFGRGTLNPNENSQVRSEEDQIRQRRERKEQAAREQAAEQARAAQIAADQQEAANDATTFDNIKFTRDLPGLIKEMEAIRDWRNWTVKALKADAELRLEVSHYLSWSIAMSKPSWFGMRSITGLNDAETAQIVDRFRPLYAAATEKVLLKLKNNELIADKLTCTDLNQCTDDVVCPYLVRCERQALLRTTAALRAQQVASLQKKINRYDRIHLGDKAVLAELSKDPAMSALKAEYQLRKGENMARMNIKDQGKRQAVIDFVELFLHAFKK